MIREHPIQQIAPSIPGLALRPFRGPADYAGIAHVVNTSMAGDGSDHLSSVEAVANDYEHVTNCDLARDMLVATVDDEMVAYVRGEWWDEVGGPLVYGLIHRIDPVWRGRGLGHYLLDWIEARMAEVAAAHDPARPKVYQLFFPESARYYTALLEAAGYRPSRYGLEMVRPSLDDIPDFPLPAGLEVRPVLPEHYRAIWEADVEAFRDHYGFAEPSPGDYDHWLNDTDIFQPALWQVAWDPATNEVAGQVRTFIDHAENEKYGRRRGYTEFISVRRPYRRRGLARALIARSLLAQREAGMTESALGVDSQSLTGATRVYEDCGFRTVTRNVVYRKPVEV